MTSQLRVSWKVHFRKHNYYNDNNDIYAAKNQYELCSAYIAPISGLLIYSCVVIVSHFQNYIFFRGFRFVSFHQIMIQFYCDKFLNFKIHQIYNSGTVVLLQYLNVSIFFRFCHVSAESSSVVLLHFLNSKLHLNCTAILQKPD